jgi:hypothetical protein
VLWPRKLEVNHWGANPASTDLEFRVEHTYNQQHPYFYLLLPVLPGWEAVMVALTPLQSTQFWRVLPPASKTGSRLTTLYSVTYRIYTWRRECVGGGIYKLLIILLFLGFLVPLHAYI